MAHSTLQTRIEQPRHCHANHRLPPSVSLQAQCPPLFLGQHHAASLFPPPRPSCHYMTLSLFFSFFFWPGGLCSVTSLEVISATGAATQRPKTRRSHSARTMRVFCNPKSASSRTCVASAPLSHPLFHDALCISFAIERQCLAFHAPRVLFAALTPHRP